MQRYTTQILLAQRQFCVRQLSTTPSLLSKASKDRATKKPKSFSATSAATSGSVYAQAPAPGQAGTDVGKSGEKANSALFETGGGQQEIAKEVTPDMIEKEFVQHQKVDDNTPEKRATENQVSSWHNFDPFSQESLLIKVEAFSQTGTDVANGGLGNSEIQNGQPKEGK